MWTDYQTYFNREYEFDDDEHRLIPNDNSFEKFREVGFSELEAQHLTESAFCVINGRTVIDRLYGGPLISEDFKTRFPLDGFRDQFIAKQNTLPCVYYARSVQDIFDTIETIRSWAHCPLVFRGQTAHHRIMRSKPNPWFVHPELGETSLMPTLWRRVTKQRLNVWHEFRNLTMLDWSKIFYNYFDLNEIHRIEQDGGLPAHSIDFAIELPDDPSLDKAREFHRQRDAFLNEFGFDGGVVFLTLLQHYGLFSPVLDLTTDPEVALFFATQKFKRDGEQCRYHFVGTNQRQAIIYVMRQDQSESHKFERTKMLEAFDPQRPKRQSCVVLGSNQWAMNLAGDFLVAAIRLDFDMAEPGRLTTADLFPTDDEDPMLAALKRHLRDGARANLTDFGD